MKALALTLLVAVLAVPLLMFGAAQATGYDGHQVERDWPQAPRETTAELLEAAVRGCVEGGGASSTGIRDGVVVARCTPAALPHLGTQPVVARKGAR